MDNLLFVQRLGALITGALAGTFAICSIYSAIAQDRKNSILEARKKRIKRIFIFLTLSFISLGGFTGFITPDAIFSIIFCFMGGLFMLLIGYGVALLQLAFLEKNKSVREIIDQSRRKK